jgi:hypothetical protein
MEADVSAMTMQEFRAELSLLLAKEEELDLDNEEDLQPSSPPGVTRLSQQQREIGK